MTVSGIIIAELGRISNQDAAEIAEGEAALRVTRRPLDIQAEVSAACDQISTEKGWLPCTQSVSDEDRQRDAEDHHVLAQMDDPCPGPRVDVADLLTRRQPQEDAGRRGGQHREGDADRPRTLRRVRRERASAARAPPNAPTAGSHGRWPRSPPARPQRSRPTRSPGTPDNAAPTPLPAARSPRSRSRERWCPEGRPPTTPGDVESERRRGGQSRRSPRRLITPKVRRTGMSLHPRQPAVRPPTTIHRVVAGRPGRAGGARTHDPRIMSPLL